ncbi:hypothetical protein QOT17_010585 [Balamuthia mandrillaris]
MEGCGEDPLEVLPVELVHQIFSSLDERALASALLTCKSWHAVAKEPSLWAGLFACSTWNPNDVSDPQRISLSQDLRTLQKDQTSCGSTSARGWLVSATHKLPSCRPVYFEVVIERDKKEAASWGCQAGVGVVINDTKGPLRDMPVVKHDSLGPGFYAARRVYPVLLGEQGWGVALGQCAVEHNGEFLGETGVECAVGGRVGVFYDDSQGKGLLNFYFNGTSMLSKPITGVRGPLYPAVQLCCRSITLTFCPSAPVPPHALALSSPA